ncbi:hypothetical protein [Streptomyces sp. NPDC012888]|uniref:hypothetical protein n=1 Tax=Streptomyces sp. NPDC012888 TaxID=3364855 RepID=UPI0036ADA977
MAGREFGHALGPRQALPWLPAAPLVPGYGALLARQRALGLRHLGELLAPPRSGVRLRVLDGVFTVGPGGADRPRHVGVDALRAAGRAAGGTGRELADRLARLQREDPAALRRVLLYQLTALLHADPHGGRAEAAVALGVDPAEAPALAGAAARQPRPGPEQRAAAERLEQEWRAGRVRTAAALAAALPAHGWADPLLAARLRGLADRVRAADAALDTARRRERDGAPGPAGAAYAEAARLAGDCPRAAAGLVRTAGPGDVLAAEPGAGGVRLRLPAGGDWRVVRLVRGEPSGAPVTPLPGRPDGTGALLDRRAPLGREVRYVAVDAGPARAWRVSPPLLVAPEARELAVADGPGRIEARWTLPDGAVGVEVALLHPGGAVDRRSLPAGGDAEFRAEGLVPGAYRLRVRCRYAPPGRPAVRSAGIETPVALPPWPAPVRTLSAEPRSDGGVRLCWTGAEDAAEVRLVEWPEPAPEPGTGLRGTAGLPAPLPWVPAGGGPAVPPPGSLTRVTAVAVLGDRAVAGPGVLVESPAPVSGLILTRVPPDLVRVRFDWPEGAGTVVVVAEQDGRRTERTVARAVFLRQGLELPVGPSAARIGVCAAPRESTAVVVVPAGPDGTPGAWLPPEVLISYDVLPGRRRRLRRGAPLVRVTLAAPGGGPGPGLPDFALVARPGTGPRPVRPRDAGDGVTVCRVGGAELALAGAVERELLPGPPAPYALRGFLLGERAASVRLAEPSPTTLVVR